MLVLSTILFSTAVTELCTAALLGTDLKLQAAVAAVELAGFWW